MFVQHLTIDKILLIYDLLYFFIKDTLLNTFNPNLTLVICFIIIIGSLTWTNKNTIKPSLPPKIVYNQNKFL